MLMLGLCRSVAVVLEKCRTSTLVHQTPLLIAPPRPLTAETHCSVSYNDREEVGDSKSRRHCLYARIETSGKWALGGVLHQAHRRAP